MKKFIKQTNELNNALSQLEDIYRNEEVVERSREFFNQIKPEVEAHLLSLEKWGETARELSKAGKLQVFPQQIDATVDNMKALIMHSYYKDVRRRRYMEIKQSCEYIFMQSIEGLHD